LESGGGAGRGGRRGPGPDGAGDRHRRAARQTVELKSTITINPYGSAGKVSSANANCVESRQVVVKEKGYGKIGSTTTSSTGSWKAEPDYKGNVPLKVWAEVKPVTQGTAGTIYKCLAATSKTITINGG
jgi:hypothetical protein